MTQESKRDEILKAKLKGYEPLLPVERELFIYGFKDGWEAATEYQESWQARALTALRAAAQVVIEQVDRDEAIGLGRSQFANLDLYEVVLTSEQVKALRVALVEGESKTNSALRLK